MTLNDAVKIYLAAAGGYEQLMPLGGFALDLPALAAMISGWEEDYHRSRHYELVPASFRDAAAPRYTIEGVEYSGIIIHASIAQILGDQILSDQ